LWQENERESGLRIVLVLEPDAEERNAIELEYMPLYLWFRSPDLNTIYWTQLMWNIATEEKMYQTCTAD